MNKANLADGRRFDHDVFISYRTSLSPDSEIAETLQRVLETYPVPREHRKDLAVLSLYPWVGSRLRVCRDITDLGANPELWEAIRQRLERSRWLIVVCTRNTPGSEWVGREIETFRGFHKCDQILTLLVDGDHAQSFHAALTERIVEVVLPSGTRTEATQRVEPLAADIRAADLKESIKRLAGRSVPKERQARFDLLAPILGYQNKDALIQRHNARFWRRVRITCAVIALVAFGIAALFWSELQKRKYQEELTQFFRGITRLNQDESGLASELDRHLPLPSQLVTRLDECAKPIKIERELVSKLLTSCEALREKRTRLIEARRRLFGDLRPDADPIARIPYQILLGEANLAFYSAGYGFVLMPSASNSKEMKQLMGHEMLRAKELYEAAHRERPELPEPLTGMGLALHAAQEYNSAVSVLAEATKRAREVYGSQSAKLATAIALEAAARKTLDPTADTYKDLYRSSLNILEPQWVELSTTIAFYRQQLGDYQNALEFFSGALPVSSRVETHSTFGMTRPPEVRAGIAKSLELLGRYAEAEPYFREGLQTEEASDDDPTAIGHSNLACNLDHQGRMAEAELHHKQALNIAIKNLGEDNVITARCHNNYALHLYNLTRYEEAHANYEKALEILRARLGERHPEVAIIHNNLAMNLDAMQRFADSRLHFDAAIQLTREAFGESHSMIASFYDNLAGSLDRQSRFAEAQPYHEKALELFREKVGERSPDTALAYTNLALNLDRQGEHAKAYPYHEKALSIFEETLPENHLNRAAANHNFGLNLVALDRDEDALLLFKKAFTTRSQVLGSNNFLTTDSGMELTRVLDRLDDRAEKSGQPERILPQLSRTLIIRRETIGNRNGSTLASLGKVTSQLFELGRPREARSLIRVFFDVKRKASEKDPETLREGAILLKMAYSLNDDARSLIVLGRWVEQCSFEQQSLSLREAQYLSVAEATLAIALLELDQPRPDLAKRQLLRAIAAASLNDTLMGDEMSVRMAQHIAQLKIRSEADAAAKQAKQAQDELWPDSLKPAETQRLRALLDSVAAPIEWETELRNIGDWSLESLEPRDAALQREVDKFLLEFSNQPSSGP